MLTSQFRHLDRFTQQSGSLGVGVLRSSTKRKRIESKLLHSRIGAFVSRAPAAYPHPAQVRLRGHGRACRPVADASERGGQLRAYGVESGQLQFAAAGSAIVAGALR